MSLKALDNGYCEEWIKELKSASIDPVHRSIPSSLKTINQALGGFRLGEVTAIAGLPGHGKSILCEQITFDLAKMFSEDEGDKKRSIYYVTLEMAAGLLMNRAIAMRGSIKSDKLTNPDRLHDVDWETINSIIEEMSAWPIAINDDNSMSIQEIITDVKKLMNLYIPRFVVIDYLQLLSGTSDVAGIDSVIRDVKRLSTECKVHVLLVSSLNGINQLRGSRAIDYNVDNVMKLERPDLLGNKSSVWENIVKLTITKARNHHWGKYYMEWEPDRLLFRDLEPTRVRDLRLAEAQESQYG